PVLLLAGAVASAAAVAYGAHPALGQYRHGLDVILWSRRLEWPQATASLILCIAVIGLVVSGKRRAWWLIGLGPVLALFVHRYYSDPLRIFAVADNPPCLPAEQASFMGDDDY